MVKAAELEKRCKDEANYIIDHNATVRQAAKVFGVSKSTIHKDMTERLPYVSMSLHKKVSEVFNVNYIERHIRGGNATKERYLRIREYRSVSEEK